MAAKILVIMPPRERELAAPPAIFSSAGSPARATATNSASGLERGSAV
ncbi:hypothetical protein EVA_12049 [gut metagenome]|uniref:Uncharacterized protein n=1 Tax=gut metagenome TaxID=749906 RepID=J9GDJ2_9ZZZZ